MLPPSPASPPKRLTRARAAAKLSADDVNRSNPEASEKPSTRKRGEATEKGSMEANNTEALEPVRKSARRAATAAPARRIKITPLAGTTNAQQLCQHDTENLDLLEKKSRTTRSKKAAAGAADNDPADLTEDDLKPKRKGSQKGKDRAKPPAPKVRGRPKKAEQSIEPEIEAADSGKHCGTRAGSGTVSTRAMAKAPSRAAVSKKVAFHGVPECDKENQSTVLSKSSTKSQPAAPAIGLRAKPVRRPVASSKAKAKQIPTKEVPGAETQRILTPKKVTQVSKAFSPTHSDEDELSGAKTPIRDLSKSPKRNVYIAQTVSPVKKLDLIAEGLAQSPVKTHAASVLLSPARRPAPSPFKDALRESPRRGDIFFKQPQMPNAKDGGPNQSSSGTMLLQSPKRAAIVMPAFHFSPSKVGKSPSKASLLGSPPKRLVSPAKTGFIHQAKPPPATPIREAATDGLSPDVKGSSHFKGTPSPQRSSHVYRITAEEVMEDVKPTIDFDQSIVDIRSPLKLEGRRAPENCEGQEEALSVQPIEDVFDHNGTMAQGTTCPQEQNHESIGSDCVFPTESADQCEASTTAPANIMLHRKTFMEVPAPSFLFRNLPAGDQDDSSDDELQSPTREFPPETPISDMAAQSTPSQSRRTLADEKPAFTPLATQLSGWLASSPERGPKRHLQSRGIFSPVAGQHVPGEVVIDRHSPAASRVSTEPKPVAALASNSMISRQSVVGRSSLSCSITETPQDKSSFFAEEMAAKDLEDEMEELHGESHQVTMLKDTHGSEGMPSPGGAPLNPAEEDAEDAMGEAGDPDDQMLGGGAETNVTSGLDDIPTEMSAPDVAERTVDQANEGNEEADETQDSVLASTSGEENIAPTTIPSGMTERPLFTPEHNGTPSTVTAVSQRGIARVRVFGTPSRPQRTTSRLANTVVSKVPLRPEGGIFPVKSPRKRSRSLSAGPFSVRKTPVSPARGLSRIGAANNLDQAPSESGSPSSSATTPGHHSFVIDDFGDSTLDGIYIDADDENLPPTTPTAMTNLRSSTTIKTTATPLGTIPKAVTPAQSSHVLLGAVVLVDVHTTEGADASGIFTELLTQMGAKCVATWSWNPRATMAVSVEDAPADASDSKIGITHVVFKDGGMRNLEKVRDTDGVVKCVGVGWVLDCERENKWLDECTYAVDISILPRGGSRRRKSMEPRALLNVNGSLSKAKTSTAGAGRRSVSAGMTQQMRDELIQTPIRGRAEVGPEAARNVPEEVAAAAAAAAALGVQQEQQQEDEESGFTTPTGLSPPASFSNEDATDLFPPATPTGFVAYDPADPAFQTPGPSRADAVSATEADIDGSPTTPYHLAQGAKLIQMTCPPKQTMKGLFSTAQEEQEAVASRKEVEGLGARAAAGASTTSTSSSSGGGSGSSIGNAQEDAAQAKAKAMRKRLLEARRRTLGWKPVVGSPLRRC